MTNRIKVRDITIETGQDMPDLNEVLKRISSIIKNTQSARRDVNKLLRLDL